MAAQARAGAACLPLLTTPASERSSEQLVQLANLLKGLQVFRMHISGWRYVWSKDYYVLQGCTLRASNPSSLVSN